MGSRLKKQAGNPGPGDGPPGPSMPVDALATTEEAQAATVTEATRLFWLDALRTAAAIAVVVLHVSSKVVGEVPDMRSLAWWVGNVADAATRWCVPVFVLISGALLLETSKREQPLAFYRKRAGRVLLPLVFWTAFYFWYRARGGGPLGLRGMANNILKGAPYHHLWFIYMIPGLYLLTPFLRSYVRGSTARERDLLVAIALVLASLYAAVGYLVEPHTETILTLYVPYVGYFLCGHQLRAMDPKRIPLWPLLLALPVCTAAIALGNYWLVGLNGLDRGAFFYDYFSPPVIVMSVAVYLLVYKAAGAGQLVPRGLGRAVAWIAPATLGIYVLHPAALDAWQRLGLSASRLPWTCGVPLVSALVLVTSLVPILVVLRVPLLRRVVS